MATATSERETSTKTTIGKVIALDGVEGQSPAAWATAPAVEHSRSLNIGDTVYADDLITTGPQAVIAIEFLDGTRFDLGRGSEMALGADVFDPSRVSTDSGAGAAPITDIDAIQQALLAGVDPTTELEAAAAGPGDASNEGSSFVILDRSTQRTTPESGYDTLGIGVEFNENVQELLLEPLEAPEVPGAVALVVGDVGAVNEDDLEAGSDQTKESLTQTGTIQITAEDGVGSLVVGGIPVISNGVFTPVSAPVDGTQGATSLSFVSYDPETGVVIYEFTLEESLQHAPIAGTNQLTQELGVILTDVDGDSAAAVLSLAVIDDIPAAGPDAGEISEDAEGAVPFNRSDNDGFGADGPASSDSIAIGSAAGQYGTLSLINGEWSYAFTDAGQAAAQLLGEVEGEPQTLTENFSYAIADADGDSSIANVVVTINGVDDPVVINPVDASVDEGDLPNAQDTKTFTISAPDGIDYLSIEGQEGPVTVIDDDQLASNEVHGEYGTLVVTYFDAEKGEVTYRYQLTDNTEHHALPGEDSVHDDFKLVLVDDDGDSDVETLAVEVIDDVPAIEVSPALAGDESPATDVVTEDAEGIVGIWSHDYGADSDDTGHATIPATIKVGVAGDSTVYNIGDQISTDQGTLTVLANGTWAFNPANGLDQDEPQDVIFTTTITDADGDVSADTHTISVLDGRGPVDGDAVALTVQEAEISDSDSRDIVFTLGSDALGSMIFNGTVGSTTGDYDDAPIVWSGAGTDTLTGSVDGVVSILLTLSNVELNNGTATVSVALSEEFKHSHANSNNTFTVNGIEVLATDIDGDTAKALASVTVVDDLPAISIAAANPEDETPATDVVTEDAEGIVGTWSHDYGADSDDTGHATVPATIKVGVSGDSTVYNIGDQISTDQGILTVLANGTWAFNPANGLDQDEPQDVIFTTTITDADGDVSTDTHTISVLDGRDPADGDAVALTVQEAEINDSDSQAIQFSVGSDPFESMVFSGTVGTTTGDYDDAAIVWTGANSNTLTGKVDDVTALVLTLSSIDLANGSATVNVALSEEFKHSLAQGNNWFTLNGIEVLATDIDGDAAKTLASVTVVDDLPVVGDVQDGIITGKDGVLTGQIEIDPGADEPVSVSVSGADNEVFVYGEQQLNDDGSVSVDVSLLEPEGEPTLLGTLNVQTDGSYTFDMQAEVVPNTFDIDFTSLRGEAGGPVDQVSLDIEWDDGDGDNEVVTATFTANSSNDDPDYINTSGNGMGVDNNLVNDGSAEAITVAFTEGTGDREFQHEVSFIINKLSSDEHIRWTATDIDGTVRTGTFTGGLGESSSVPMALLVSNLAAGTDYETIQIDAVTDPSAFTGIHEMTFQLEEGSDFRVLSMSASDQRVLIPEDLDLLFDVQFTDSDGDPTVTSALNIHIEADDVLESGGYTLTGEAGSESILGSPAADVISAGEGDNRIEGAGGDDEMAGGSGTDTFVYNASGSVNEGQDTISEFNKVDSGDNDASSPPVPGEDVLQFRDALDAPSDGIVGLEELQTIITNVSHDGANNTTLHLYDGGSIELLGFGQYTTLDSLLDTGIEIQLIPPDS